jgi:hypothetical protein
VSIKQLKRKDLLPRAVAAQPSSCLLRVRGWRRCRFSLENGPVATTLAWLWSKPWAWSYWTLLKDKKSVLRIERKKKERNAVSGLKKGYGNRTISPAF